MDNSRSRPVNPEQKITLKQTLRQAGNKFMLLAPAKRLHRTWLLLLCQVVSSCPGRLVFLALVCYGSSQKAPYKNENEVKDVRGLQAERVLASASASALPSSSTVSLHLCNPGFALREASISFEQSFDVLVEI